MTNSEQTHPLAALRSMELLNGVGDDELQEFAPLMRLEHFRRGDVIVREGEPCRAVYAVVSGLVKRFKTSADGKEQVLKVIGPGEAFNEVPLLDGGPNPAGAEALDDSSVYVLDRDRFHEAMARNPAVAIALLQVLARRVRHLVGLVEDLSLRQVSARLAHLLLEQDEVARTLTQQEIGAMVGAAREVVSRALRSLEETGAIMVDHGRVTVTDRGVLERML